MSSVGFWQRAKGYPDQIAVIDELGRVLTSGSLLSACNRISNRLVSLGIGHGDVVATLLPSSVDLVLFMLATRQSGLYLLPLNPRVRAGELKHLIEDSCPRLIVAGTVCARPDLGGSFHSTGTGIEWIDGSLDIDARLSKFLSGASDATPEHRKSGEILTYTSGTTGMPKAVLRKAMDATPEAALQPALEWYVKSFNIDLRSPGTFLSACPIYYSGPLSFASYAIHAGRTLALMPQWNARLALALIAKHKVTETFLVPYQLRDLLNEYMRRPGKFDISSLKTVIHGSAPCPPDLKAQALDVLGEIVYESYGSTEVAGTVANPQEASRYRGTVGRAIAPHEVKILDEFGAPCPPGKVGRVFMKMLPGTEFSYRDDPDATRACQVREFATAGDLGFVNESGYLFLKGRDSEIINCRGEKVHPAIVERAASEHSHVADAAAFGGSCDEGGETVNLAVKLSTAGRPMGQAVRELLACLRLSLRRVEVPTSIFVVNDIPREQSGKIRRRELEAFVEQQAVFEMRDSESPKGSG